MKTNTESESIVAQTINSSPFFQEDPQKDEETKTMFKKVQERLTTRMKRLDFEIQVFFSEQKAMLEENQFFTQDIPTVLEQLIEYELTPKLFEAFEKAEQLDYALVDNAWLVQQTQDLLKENLTILQDDLDEALKALDLKPDLLTTLKLTEFKAEKMFMIMKNMGLFNLKVDEDGWLTISFKKENHSEISYEEVRTVEKIKVEGLEHIEIMLYGLNFLLENCIEKTQRLRISAPRRYISNREAERFNKCEIWRNHKIDLTFDFHECTFESEDTLLMFFRDSTKMLENMEGLRLLLANTNATQKTIESLCELIKPRMKSLKNFVFDASDFTFNTIPEINKVLLNKASELLLFELGIDRTHFNDNEVIVFSETVLPELNSLQQLKLWLGNTQVTDKGLLSFFKGLQENCASYLKVLWLLTADNAVTDESVGELALNTLPLMKNLEEFTLSLVRTLVTDRMTIELCRNIKYVAPKLKRFWLNVGTHTVSDAMINVLALESMPLMKEIKCFSLWLYRAKLIEKSFWNLFSSMATFSAVEELELSCTQTDLSDESLSIFANKALPEMKGIKKFYFYGSKTKVQDVSLQVFFQNLSKCEKLQKMVIWFNDTAIGDESLVSLAETISQLAHLIHLDLSFYETKLGDLGISHLCKSLKGVARNLDCLKLDLNDTRVTDEGILALGNEIAPEMRSLKELKLWISRTRIGDAGLKPIFENLEMGSLQDFTLRLNGSLITDQGLLTLAGRSLRSAESLRAVELWATNTKLSDLGLVPLMHSLKSKVGDVNKLNLMLQNTKITDGTVEVLSTEVLMNMRNLQDFQLNLALSQVTDASMVMLIGSLTNSSQRLKKLVLQLNSAISDNSIRILADKVLPNLGQVRDLKLTWSGSLSSSALKALCLNANRTIQDIKTFQISSSQLSVMSCSNRASHECLEDLSLELNRTRVNDSDMREILESFEGQVSRVKNFSFLVERSGVSNSSIKTLAEKLFLFMPNLESVKLALNDIALSDEALCIISCSLENFASKIKEFKMDLRLPKLNHSTITTFADRGLAQMTNLENLDIEFYSEKNRIVEPTVLVNLFAKMQNCVKKLKNFSFSVFHLNLAPEVIQTLATSVFPNLESSVDIYLSLHETGINDSEFSSLFSGLKNGVLENNKYFGVAIFEPALSGQALEILAVDILPQLKNMEIFGCYLFGNEKFQDESFIKFNKSWQEVASQITKIIFKFEHTGITDVGVKEFALKTLPVMQNLKMADISLGNTAKLGDEGIVDLFDGLGGIVGRLSPLKLDLQRTGITDAGIEAIKKRQDVEAWKKCSLDILGTKVSPENKSFVSQHFKG